MERGTFNHPSLVGSNTNNGTYALFRDGNDGFVHSRVGYISVFCIDADPVYA